MSCVARSEALSEAPACSLRLWDLWDNTDESIERGYAGKSVFNWSILSYKLGGGNGARSNTLSLSSRSSLRFLCCTFAA